MAVDSVFVRRLFVDGDSSKSYGKSLENGKRCIQHSICRYDKYVSLRSRGAAFATIFSQGISFVISVIHLKRSNFVFDFQPQHFLIKPDKLEAILKVGLPTATQMIVVNFSYLLITGMLNQFGVSVAAASGVGLKINTFDSFAIGIGSTNIAVVNALLDAVIIRLPVSWLLAFPWSLGFPGVYIGLALSPLLPAAVGLIYFKSKGWQNKRII